jgi:8-oxo-dGTP diphosphatase
LVQIDCFDHDALSAILFLPIILGTRFHEDSDRELGRRAMFLPPMVYDPEFEVGTSNLERYCANMAGRNVSVLILYNNESKILLQHRTKDAPTFPDYWAFFGGGIEEGESAEQAVKRESLEELGYELTGPRLFTAQKFFYKGNEYTKHVFVEQYNGKALTLGEGQAMGWFLAAETRDLMMNDHDRSVIDAMKNILSPPSS